jgi:uncharacterized protein YdhG (YjbR/CyaY superfamily)
MAGAAIPKTVDQYIEACSPEVRPAFMLQGMLVYFAAFKKHVGLYPPVRGDAKLKAAAAKYASPKGNHKFPLDRPIPCALIARIVKARVKQNLAKAAARGTR